MTTVRRLEKADGRALWLYSRGPIPEEIVAPSPEGADAPPPNPHLRWHPLRGEWVVYAGHRQHRTFLPPPEWNPLAPTSHGAPPTELPAGPWEVAVFENRFPTLAASARDAPPGIVPSQPALGACEVVVYSQDPRKPLGALPLGHVALVLEVWADRTRALGSRDDVQYVMPFENRGEEVGVTLHHPHGQIYAYPFVPPLPARELSLQLAHYESAGSGLLATHIAAEQRDAVRMVFDGALAVAFVPAFARYAYEVWVAPVRPVPELGALTADERLDLARALKSTLVRLDGVFGRAMPYVLVVHQAPVDGRAHPEAHVHVEIYPALRMRNRLKYLAGCELGAGTFTADTLPEEKAAELRAVQAPLD